MHYANEKNTNSNLLESIIEIASKLNNNYFKIPSKEFYALSSILEQKYDIISNTSLSKRIIWANTANLLRQHGLYSDNNEISSIWPYNGMIVLNPFLGCSVGCAYCFRPCEMKDDLDWFLHGRPIKVEEEKRLIDGLDEEIFFLKNKTLIGLHTATTEPFLPEVKESTFNLLDMLDKKGFKNNVLIITKYYLNEEDIKKLDQYENFNIFLLLTFNNHPSSIEPLNASKNFINKKWKTLELLNKFSKNILYAHYYRPIIDGCNDSTEQIEEVLTFGEQTGITVIGGLKYTHKLEEYLKEHYPKKLNSSNKKYLKKETIEKIIEVHAKLKLKSTIVQDQSCGLTLLMSRKQLTQNIEALGMQNRIACKKNEFCIGHCSEEQFKICNMPPAPTEHEIKKILHLMNLKVDYFSVNETSLRLYINETPSYNILEMSKFLTSTFRYLTQVIVTDKNIAGVGVIEHYNE